jgi:hypothetical protein
MSGHTPGPWKPVLSDTPMIQAHTEFGVVDVAQVFGGFAVEDITFADAHLIAAAPELLEALEALAMVWLDQSPHADNYAQALARNAIAKARGAHAAR